MPSSSISRETKALLDRPKTRLVLHPPVERLAREADLAQRAQVARLAHSSRSR